MNNVKEAFIEHIHLKKRVNRWRLMFFSLIVGIIIFLPFKQKDLNNFGNYIAKIKVEGEISENQDRIAKIEQLALNPNVKAVILHINSPGGTFVGGEALYNSLSYLASKKSLVATMGTMAASVGYMIALPAERVFAYKGTITGSIGVFLQTPDLSELMKKLGVSFVTVKSGKFKTTLSPFETITDEARRTVESAINDSYITFIDFVVEKRKLDKDRLLEIADGRVYTGNQALDLNLIDEIGNERSAIAWLQENKNLAKGISVRDINLIEERAFLEKFKINSRFIEFFLGKLQISLAGLISIWQN